MGLKFLHTADIHLGKSYRSAEGEAARYEDFFTMLGVIVSAAVAEKVDFVLIAGDLFHTGQILPRTFARTIEALQPLKDSGIPCIAVEGNHDWIHRRDSISWMEALSEMGYIALLRPSRTDDGGYRFDPFDRDEGRGGHIEIGGVNIYGLGYIGAQAGSHVERICEAVTTSNNIILFHVGIWSCSPVEIGNMKPEEALPLADKFDYVALGHGHKPYTFPTPEGRTYAFNPGSPECVNFGEGSYPKGYYIVTSGECGWRHEFRTTTPRPMLVMNVDLDGAQSAEEALLRLREQVGAKAAGVEDPRAPLLELKLTGRVGFHPFELGKERLRATVAELCRPLHVEIKNHLSLVTGESGSEKELKNLAEIEGDVLLGLISSRSEYKGREEELVKLSIAIRDQVMKGECDGEELLGILEGVLP
ncbi:MAG: exonuclease SbcCD subunit D [Chlorobiaceae bacterium]